ncbi:MAG: PmeII family type II restriction endonuclease [Thermoflexales bacterium]|nr:PmeII family type II restriction endonuclease [Thermoflexales bacterium]
MSNDKQIQIAQFIEEQINTFHQRRLESLSRLKLAKLLRRKNPYLLKAKNLEVASDLVKSLLDAHLIAQEETLFGDFLEKLAIFVCRLYFEGRKSDAEGIDLEFSRGGKFYIVSIKSGPHWGNAQQIKRMVDNFRNFREAKRNMSDENLVAVNGCCYGRDLNENKGDYLKLCGQSFWELISGDREMYLRIIEPLGHRAKERNDAFYKEYAQLINRFTEEFMRDFCKENGAIDWQKLVAFSSRDPRA